MGRVKRIDMCIHEQDKRFPAGMLFSMAKPKVVGRKVNDGRVIPHEGQIGDEQGLGGVVDTPQFGRVC